MIPDSETGLMSDPQSEARNLRATCLYQALDLYRGNPVQADTVITTAEAFRQYITGPEQATDNEHPHP